jgi:hypothetical protein
MPISNFEDMLAECQTILYVGCGGFKSNAHFGLLESMDKVPRRVAIDTHAGKLGTWRFSGWTTVCQDGSDLSLFEDKSFDAVVSIDFIEHLTKEAGEHFLDEVDRVCKKFTYLMTPKGFLDVKVYQADLIRSDYDLHLSGWEPEELEARGYETFVTENFHHFELPEPISFGILEAWKRY